MLKYTNIFDDDDDKEDCSSNNSVDESLSLVTDIQTPYQSEAWESGPSTPIYDICSSDLPSIPHVAGIDDTVQHWNHNYKAAQTIFQGPASIAVRSTIQAGHRMLYARSTTNGNEAWPRPTNSRGHENWPVGFHGFASICWIWTHGTTNGSSWRSSWC